MGVRPPNKCRRFHASPLLKANIYSDLDTISPVLHGDFLLGNNGGRYAPHVQFSATHRVLPVGYLCAGRHLYIQTTLQAVEVEVDFNKIWLVGGILAFLLGFGGFQKSLEEREKANQPTVSSADVMQKLTPTETGKANPDLDIPPEGAHGPEADSPLGRLRARSEPLEL